MSYSHRWSEICCFILSLNRDGGQVGPVERITLPLHDDPGSDRVSHKGYAFVQFADGFGVARFSIFHVTDCLGKVNSARHSVVYAMKVYSNKFWKSVLIVVPRDAGDERHLSVRAAD